MLFKFFSESAGIFLWDFPCCSALLYLLIHVSPSLILPSLLFHLPSLASVFFALELTSLSSFLSSLWASLKNGEEFSCPILFGVESPLVKNESYAPQLQASTCWVVVCKCFICSLVNHRNWEFWILCWAVLNKISLSFIIWPNLYRFSQKYWEAHMIQRPFHVKYQN